jgi:hypothetical protein
MDIGKANVGDADVLLRAKSYPYDVQQSCFALISRKTVQLLAVDLESPLDSPVLDRNGARSLRSYAKSQGVELQDMPTVPVLAYGSNASIAGLRRKFAGEIDSTVIPVAHARLTDFDIVYSSHISPYGAIPAALQYCPKAIANVQILFVTEAQRRILCATEPNYLYAELMDLDLRIGDVKVTTVSSFLTRHGMLSRAGTEVALASSVVEGRRFPAKTEEQALRMARDMTAPDTNLDAFVLQNVADVILCRARTNELKATARAFEYPFWRLTHG